MSFRTRPLMHCIHPALNWWLCRSVEQKLAMLCMISFWRGESIFNALFRASALITNLMFSHSMFRHSSSRSTLAMPPTPLHTISIWGYFTVNALYKWLTYLLWWSNFSPSQQQERKTVCCHKWCHHKHCQNLGLKVVCSPYNDFLVSDTVLFWS